MRILDLHPSYRQHLFIGLFISFWLVVFLVVIAPFDTADLSLRLRILLMPVYGLIAFVSYTVLLPLQNWLFQRTQKWTMRYEVLFIGLFQGIALLGSFIYYKSNIINGEYAFRKFTLEVYYPIFIVLLSIIIFARWFLFRRQPKRKDERVTLHGENKHDILQINWADLVSVSSADNYVEVRYLTNGDLQQKLLRNTLKNIQRDLPQLVKVHRSHLINPQHFKEWRDGNTIILTKTELPVSKKFKPAVLKIKQSSLKANSSSQTP